MAIFLSALSGLFIAVMVILNASLGARIGILESSFTAHLAGALFGTILLGFFWGENSLRQIAQAPKFLLAGGVFGVLIVLVANAAVPRLGMILTIGLFLTGNLIFAVIADHFGLLQLPVHKVSPRRALGITCAIAGLILAL